MSDHARQIKSMKLYTHIGRIHNELVEMGRGPGDALCATQISAFDQLHYHGTSAVDDAIARMGLCADTRVLEIGSGLGGPARHITHRTGAQVLALELQPDQHRLATELTARCGLSSRVRHVCGDFLTHDWQGLEFDAIVSWLALFHIPDRQALLDRSRGLLVHHGLFYAEDLYRRRPMTSQASAELATGMYAAYLPDYATYQQDFAEAGFDVLTCEDLSDDWTEFTTQRLQDHHTQRDRHIRVHGEPTYRVLAEFYDLVNRHFRSGALGGVRILARRH